MNRKLKVALLVGALCATLSAQAWPQSSGTVANHAVVLGKGAGVVGFGAAAPGASGTVLQSNGTGSDPSFQAFSGSVGLTNGSILVGNASNVATAQVLSQDCTITNTAVITCLKTNNVSFGALATLTPGTGVATALAVNVGSAGAFLTFNGAGGTPSSMVGTNITGTASGLTAGNVTTNANLTGDVTSVGNATTLVTSQTGAHTWSAVQTLSAGAVGAPSVNFGDATTGFYKFGTNQIGVATTGSIGTGFDNASGFRVASNYFICISGTAGNPFAACQVTLFRSSSGVLGIGTTTTTANGSLAVTNITMSGALNGLIVTTTAGTLTVANNASASLITSGNFALTLTASATTNATFPAGTTNLSQTVASGAKALATGAIASAACTTAQTDTATGTATTDAIMVSFNADPTAVTGYVPLTTGMLTIVYYPTANTVNFKVCNNTGSSITPGAVTINWRVVR